MNNVTRMPSAGAGRLAKSMRGAGSVMVALHSAALADNGKGPGQVPANAGLLRGSTRSPLLRDDRPASALADVCFGPIADIEPLYSITSSARASNAGGMSMPIVLA